MSSEKKSLNDSFKEFSNQSHKSYTFQILRERSKFVYTYEKKYVFNIAIPFIWYQKREIILFKLGIKKVGCFSSTALYWKILCKYFFFTQGWYGAKTIIYISKKREIFQQAMAENINTLFLYQFHVSLSYIIQYITFQKSNGRLTCCLQRDLLVARNEIMSSRLTTAVFQTEKNPHRSE